MNVFLSLIYGLIDLGTYFYKQKHAKCYGTQPADCNELFPMLLISGEYLSRGEFFPT